MAEYPVAILFRTYSTAMLREYGAVEYFTWPCFWDVTR